MSKNKGQCSLCREYCENMSNQNVCAECHSHLNGEHVPKSTMGLSPTDRDLSLESWSKGGWLVHTTARVDVPVEWMGNEPKTTIRCYTPFSWVVGGYRQDDEGVVIDRFIHQFYDDDEGWVVDIAQSMIEYLEDSPDLCSFRVYRHNLELMYEVDTPVPDDFVLCIQVEDALNRAVEYLSSGKKLSPTFKPVVLLDSESIGDIEWIPDYEFYPE